MPESFSLFQTITSPMGWVCIMYRWFPKYMKEEIWWVTTRICYPMFITAMVMNAILEDGWTAWVARICLPVWIIMWVQDYKDDHDDRWKKRRKKLLARVQVQGRKLVVTPVTHN